MSLHQPLSSNGFNNCSDSVLAFLPPGECPQLSTFNSTPLHCTALNYLSWTRSVELHSLWADHIKNTASNSSSVVELRRCCTDRLESTASTLVHLCMLGTCCLATGVVSESSLSIGCTCIIMLYCEIYCILWTRKAWKEEFLVCFKEMCQHLPGKNEWTHKRSQSSWA